MNDLISVVVPVYNAANYLDACLESLRAQDYPNWEAVLVDDGSTDDSPRLCDAWAAKEPRIRVLHRENGGVSAARNAGIAEAKGELLAFLDSDDRIEPTFLSTLRHIMGDTDLAICSVEDGGQSATPMAESSLALDTLRRTPSRYADLAYINFCTNKLYRASIIQKYDLGFPVGVRRSEDVNFVQDYLMHCKTMAVTSDQLYHYDQHDGSAMHRFYTGVCDDEIPLMKRQYDLFHPDGPDSLTPEEEIAFQKWQFGKVLGILRYINAYAPDMAAKRSYARQLLQEPHARQSILQPPPGTGRKAKLAAFFVKTNAYGPLMKLMEHM